MFFRTAARDVQDPEVITIKRQSTLEYMRYSKVQDYEVHWLLRNRELDPTPCTASIDARLASRLDLQDLLHGLFNVDHIYHAFYCEKIDLSSTSSNEARDDWCQWAVALTSIGIVIMAFRGELGIPYVQSLAKAPGNVSRRDHIRCIQQRERNPLLGPRIVTVIHPALPLIQKCKMLALGNGGESAILDQGTLETTIQVDVRHDNPPPYEKTSIGRRVERTLVLLSDVPFAAYDTPLGLKPRDVSLTEFNTGPLLRHLLKCIRVPRL
ncbi:hypothetical protein ARMGADRAFT_1085106 [Armillaria gallica]|uniref:Uncharacterized protein n=1 Tax=Armillaria gallica TaxID=47427 RepID=A0A2H3DAA0_ARMGA|nr:hypothetical protein ARMGADRAFT_1085106 [Armillaria gallica]